MGHSFVLAHDDIHLRIVRMKDVRQIEAQILGNRDWLRPWEASIPGGMTSFDIKAMVRGLLRQLDDKIGMPFVIEIDGKIIGQVNVANIIYGSLCSCAIGYWISPDYAGQSIIPIAVALVIDYLFNNHEMHRVEIDIRPENKASLRVVEKLGLRYEGLKERFIHINGDWRDHYVFAVTHEEVPNGLLNRFLRSEAPVYRYPWTQIN